MMFYHGNREVNKTYSKMQNGERDTSALEELCHCLSPMPDIGMGNAAVQLDELNVMDFIEPLSSRSWLAALTPQGKVSTVAMTRTDKAMSTVV